MSRPTASSPTAALIQIHRFRRFGCGLVVDIGLVGRLLAWPRGRITRTG
ncbi:hypothetical protein OJ998_05070 [Solirubrobacter taibaiensis]|nr:hypothetical protein [Solirubrobacter taibaiensis]